MGSPSMRQATSTRLNNVREATMRRNELQQGETDILENRGIRLQAFGLNVLEASSQ